MDDLTLIHGIGDATAEKLVAAGIDSFSKLAAATTHDIDMAIDGGRPSAWPAWIAAAAKRAAEADQANQHVEALPQGSPSPAVAPVDPLEVLLHWEVACQRLAAVTDLAARAQAALVALQVDAPEPERKKADDAQAEASAAVAEVIAAILVLPSLPTRVELAPLFAAAPEAPPPSGVIDPETLRVLAIDRDQPVAALRAARIKGPRGGRWRRGHNFTDAAQTLLISRQSYEQLKADPLISVELLDQDD